LNRQEFEAYKHTIDACIDLLWRASIPAKVVLVHMRRLERIKEIMDCVYWGNVPMDIVNDELVCDMVGEVKRSKGQRRTVCP